MERIGTDTLHFSRQHTMALPLSLGELSPQVTERALALPLGELSPQVTERALQPFLNSKINLCAHTTKIFVNIPVGESQNLQTKSHQELRAFRIISNPLGFIMLRPIQFNDQAGRSTVKVHDEPADDPLFVDFYWVFTQKKIPKLTFLGRHLPAKPPCVF